MNKNVKYLIGIAAIIAGGFFIWYFSNIVVYIIIAVVVAMIGRPLMNIIKRLKIWKFQLPNAVAALITLAVIWGIAVTFFSLFIPLIFNKISVLANVDVNSIASYLKEPIAKFESFLHEYFAVNTANISIPEMVSKYGAKIFDTGALNTFFSSIISVVGRLVVALFAVTFISFFFLKDETLFQRMLVAIIPAKHEDKIKHALKSSSHFLSRYFIGVLCDSTIIMLVISIVLILCGYPVSDAFFIGIIAGVFNTIPYIGPWVGFAINLMVGLALVSSDMTFTFIFFSLGITTLCVQLLDGGVLQPLLYSNIVKAHPLEIFIVIIMGSTIAGVVGMLIAIPTYTILRVIAKEFFNRFRFVNKLTENMEGK